MLKKENEITVKVACSNEELIDILNKNCFEEYDRFSLDDYYFVPSYIDINKLSVRNILSKAVIVRKVEAKDIVEQCILFKTKDINEKGEILNQESVKCKIFDALEARKLLEKMGYVELMNIKEDDIVQARDGFNICIKYIEKSNILIECETTEDSKYDTIEKVKEEFNKLEIPIENNDYFVKKAEIELEKVLKR